LFFYFSYHYDMENEIEDLKHRIRMIEDDLKVIQDFIESNNLKNFFLKPSSTSDTCITNFSNIEIACDLTSDESLSWKPFNLK